MLFGCCQKAAKHFKIKSGCGAVGSALPWGGRGRKFKSCHSDQEKHRKRPFSVLFSFVFSGFSYFFGQTPSSIKALTTIATTIDFLRLNKGKRKFNTFWGNFIGFSRYKYIKTGLFFPAFRGE